MLQAIMRKVRSDIQTVENNAQDNKTTRRKV